MADFLVFQDLPQLVTANETDELLIVQSGVAMRQTRSEFSKDFLSTGSDSKKRIHELTPQSVLDNTQLIPIDRSDYGEARSITLQQLAVFLGAGGGGGGGGSDPGLQIYVDECQTFASNAQSSAADASDAATRAQASATDTAANKDLVGQYVTANPGVEIEPGKYSLSTFVQEMNDLLAVAPSLSGKYINSAGPVGTDNIDLTTDDFYHTIEVNRAAGHDTNLRCLSGLYTGPPPGGKDRSYAWIHVIRSGDGDVFVQPPAGGSTVFPPVKIAEKDQNSSSGNQTLATNPARTVTITMTAPAATSRQFVAFLATDYHIDTSPGHSATVSCPQVTGLTKVDEKGHGTYSNAAPILTSLWSGTIAGTASTDMTITLNISAVMARYAFRAFVFQDVSGVQNGGVTLRAGAVTTETLTLTPSQAQSCNLVFAAHQDSASSPVNITPVGVGDVTKNNNTAFTNVRDICYATLEDNNTPASAVTYTGTGAAASPAVIAGITLQPRTSVSAGTLITALSPIKIPLKGGHGYILAASDGLNWYFTA